MPFCPGCEREVPYTKLEIHVRYCPQLNGGTSSLMSEIEQLDRRLAAVERSLQYRKQQTDRELDSTVTKLRPSSDRSSDRDNKS